MRRGACGEVPGLEAWTARRHAAIGLRWNSILSSKTVEWQEIRATRICAC